MAVTFDLSRTTKVLAIASNLLALWLVAVLVSRAIPSLLGPTVAIFTVSLLCAVLLGDLAASLVLSTVYFVPTICFLWFGRFVNWYYVMWLAGLCGAMLPRSLGSAWALPPRFRPALVLWALVLALSWPIVVLREVDFVPAMLTRTGIPATLPQSPTLTTVWIACVASIALTGLLLLDWLFLVYPAERLERFESRVIRPLLGGAACAAVIGAYQSMVDISFLQYTMFRSVGRAAGPMGDANAFGAAMALWVPIATATAIRRTGPRYMTAVWCALVAILLIAVWGSGSRTAILAAVVGLTVVIAHLSRSLSLRQALAGVAGAIVLCAAVVWLVPSTAPRRAMTLVPSLSADGLHDTLLNLWGRDGYGTAADQMIVEHPYVGVGVGGYNYQFSDVLFLLNGSERPPDNAQNWFRQQLAELGILGSLGWIVWSGLFLWMLVTRPDPGGPDLTASAAKGAVFGLTAASLLGMPTQDTAVSISFVIVACWCMKLRFLPGSTAAAGASRASRYEWVAVLVVLSCFLGGTVYEARTDLRRPVRALRVAAPYSYGFAPDNADPAVRWTTRGRAVEVFRAEKRWLKLVIGDVAPDAAANPVSVEVRLNRELILRVKRQGNFPITRWIRMPVYGTPLMMQIDVGRTWRPLDFGDASDQGTRGVALREWLFQDEDPPKGSVTFESPPAPMFGMPGE